MLPPVGVVPNWRNFFKKEELEQGKKFVQKNNNLPIIESDSEDASDSQPSCDNLEKNDLEELIPFSVQEDCLLEDSIIAVERRPTDTLVLKTVDESVQESVHDDAFNISKDGGETERSESYKSCMSGEDEFNSPKRMSRPVVQIKKS